MRCLLWVLPWLGVACGDGAPAVAIDMDEGTLPTALIYAPVLGGGVNYAEDQTFAQCVTSNQTTHTASGFGARLYDETRVQTHADLDKSLDIRAAVRAKGLWGNAKGSATYFKNVTLSEDALFWLVKAHYDLSTEIMDMSPAADFGLTPFALDVLQRRGIAGFYKSCGTHFYIGRKLGARYDVLYEFRLANEKTLAHVQAKAGATPLFGLKAAAKFKNFLAAAKDSAVMNVHAEIHGGGADIRDYADPASQPEDPGNLQSILAQLRTDLERNNKGDVLEWVMQTYDIFPEVQEAKERANWQDLLDSMRDDALAHYYGLYVRNMAQLAHLNVVLDRADGSEPYYVFAHASGAAIVAQIAALRDQNLALRHRAEGCLSGAGDCATDGLDVLRFVVPEPERDLSGLGEWSVLGMLRPGGGVDLFGERVELGTQPRTFRSHAVLLALHGDAVARITDRKGGVVDVVIGTYQQKADAGRSRLGICIGDFSDVCSFRITEDKKHSMVDDGTPTPKMHLTIYDTYGFVRADHYFLADGPT